MARLIDADALIYALETIDYGSKFKTDIVEDLSYFFFNCSSLLRFKLYFF